MKYIYVLITLSSIFILTGCTCKYKDQLEYYQNTIGNQCFYYMDKDANLDQKVKDNLTKIQTDTTKLLGE